MATLGNWTWFDQALLKFADGPQTIDLSSDAFKVVLTTSTQALSKSFNGTSTNCQFSDLTAELPTLHGYTNGGLALSGVSLTRSSSTVIWTASSWTWTIDATGIQFKYAVIFDNTATNKDLLCFVDMDTSTGGNVTVSNGSLIFAPLLTGILNWSA